MQRFIFSDTGFGRSSPPRLTHLIHLQTPVVTVMAEFDQSGSVCWSPMRWKLRKLKDRVVGVGEDSQPGPGRVGRRIIGPCTSI